MKQQIINRKEYSDLLTDIKSILQKGLYKAYKAVDNLKVQIYWQIGERIVRDELKHKQRAEYGKNIIILLARDLKCSRSLIFEVVQFYRTYPIVHALCGQLSWSHYRTLIKIQNKEERRYYQTVAINSLLSIRELKKRILSDEYKRARGNNHALLKSAQQLPLPEDVFKESYNWDFLELEMNHSERQLEKAVLNNVEKVLLEFGNGFAFIGSQQKMVIGGQHHKIDLLFYHRLLRCLAIVELKNEKFRAEFIGQMNKYLTYFRESKFDWEREPIGLIICKGKDYDEVHYALGKLDKDIFVAEYREYLPSEGEIRRRLRNRT